MNLASFLLLNTTLGEEALSSAQALEPKESNYLQHFQILSRSYPPELAQAALETVILRREAGSKFSNAEQMYFTRSALEQATSEIVAAWRAKRFRELDQVLDYGCSIAADTLQLARYLPTIGLDIDMLRLAMAKANVAALQPRYSIDFILADLRSYLPLSLSGRSWGVFFDPSRRKEGKRIYSVEKYSPPLSVITNWLQKFPAMGVKISPGVRLEQLSPYQAEIEFVSQDGDLKEAVMWFGPLKTTLRRATVLPGGQTIEGTGEQRSPLRSPLNYLYEPDPAVLRAHLVGDLAAQLDAAQLDPDIAYLTAEKSINTPFARCWQIEDWFPFQLKRLRAYLRERQVGHVVVKKRGSPLEPEALIRQLKLKGDQSRVVFLTHLAGHPIIIICFDR